eukprot:1431209-Rhodomonas_salina.1
MAAAAPDVRAVGDTELLVLNREDLRLALDMFPGLSLSHSLSLPPLLPPFLSLPPSHTGTLSAYQTDTECPVLTERLYGELKRVAEMR